MALTEKERLRFPGVTDFPEFLATKKIPVDDPQIPLLRDAWNAAVGSFATYLRSIEGTDFRIAESLKES